MRLTDLRDNEGARKTRTRVGRGIGSGKGKTGGRGVKGQKSRSGVAIKGFEGGQMPLHMRLPKRGFNLPNAKDYVEINLATLQAAADAGHSSVTEDGLVEAGLIRRKSDGLRLLGSGELSSKLDVTVTYATKSAREAIEKAGGTVTMTRPEKHKRLRGPHKTK
ncbi:50S ribosomal protein L15 [Parvularcula sp. LCG005]|uniref:50S ribosomal protein L15 n=1 Tax=Parvularcula sp. LCG005 TaxID=3078805 RepID=UPI0029439FA0|nr:50S ribosomal protein L15 [Parvularcula sp. LCG005]WOI54484.1 50S ribosomal protein L15 [Parvularcula sp. LCG005]